MRRGCGRCWPGKGSGPRTDIVALNAGALLMTAGKAPTCARASGWRATPCCRGKAGQLLIALCRGEQWLTSSTGSSRASARKSPRASAAGRSRRRADDAQPPRGAGPARRALHHGGEARIAVGASQRCRVEEAVAAYAPVADAISVLTDGPDFGGSLDDLRMVRAAVRRADPGQGFHRRSRAGQRGARAPAPTRCWR